MDPQAAIPTTEPMQSTVPETWPGAFGLYKYAKAATKYNLGVIASLIVLGWAISVIANLAIHNASAHLIADIIGWILDGVLVYTMLCSAKRQSLNLEHAFSAGLRWLPKLFVTVIIMGFAMILSLLVLIIPFFFVMPRLLLAPYFMIDKDLGPMQAVQASWAASKGNATHVWAIIGVNFLISILVITIIGIPFSIYFYVMYSTAYAVLYEMINRQPAPAAAPLTEIAAPTS